MKARRRGLHPEILTGRLLPWDADGQVRPHVHYVCPSCQSEHNFDYDPSDDNPRLVICESDNREAAHLLVAYPADALAIAEASDAWAEITASIRSVLLEHWDPCEVANNPEACDRYDQDVAGVYTLLVDNNPDADLAAHFATLEATLGLEPRDQEFFGSLIAHLRALSLPRFEYPQVDPAA